MTRRRTLAELHERAHEELRTNPSITVYEITWDGVELRRPANPYAGLNASMQRVTEAFNKMGESLQGIALKMSSWMPGDDERTASV